MPQVFWGRRRVNKMESWSVRFGMMECRFGGVTVQEKMLGRFPPTALVSYLCVGQETGWMAALCSLCGLCR